MDDKSLHKKIKHIEIQTTRLAEDVLAGPYHSAFKGRGMEFEEVMEYQPGDDVRLIDWNVTARADRPFIKTFKEERDLKVLLLVDVSSSTRYGSQDLLKRDLMVEIAAVIAFSAIKNNDKVGLILFSDEIEKYIPPKKGSAHVLRLIREMIAFEPKSSHTDLEKVFSFLGNTQKNKAVCFLISDFIAKDNYFNKLSLIAKKHDLIAINLLDKYEKDFPSIGIVQLGNLEGEDVQVFNSSNKQFQEAFKQAQVTQKNLIKKTFLKNGASFLEVISNVDYIPLLRKFFRLRARKR